MNHLQKYGSITQQDAMQEYAISRLASRVHDLKTAGFPIAKQMETGKNRFGEPTRYARYFLIGEKK